MSKALDKSTTEAAINPTSSTSRILHLDIFRGFAIFGIFMVNILVMNTSFLYRNEWLVDNASWLNGKVDWMLQMFFFSKFFPIFSFLFGIGVALQIRSLKAKKTASTPFLIRRFLALLVFGLSHLFFLWSGDILHLYAMFGFVLMFMYRTPPIVILLTAIALFVFPYFDEIYQYLCDYFSVNPGISILELTRSQIAELKVNGSYFSGIRLRMAEYGFAMSFIVSIIVPVALTMALLGLYIVRKGIIDRIDAFVRKTWLPFLICLIVILTYRFTFQYWVLPNFTIEMGSMKSFALWTLFFVSEVMISFTYLYIIVFALRSNIGKRILSPLQYVGRMAFTNYILQSVIGYLTMRTFGYFESFSLYQCSLFVIVVFAFQIPLSWFWLKHFKFGPLEWLWRCISYWKVLPIKKT